MSTIVAISTAPGIGGIGIVRMSGEQSFDILKRIFVPKDKNAFENINGYTIKYGTINDGSNVIDEVLVSFFKEPKSYTTENMCEINSHGGIVVLNKILELCLKNGAVLAEAGEFTKRAFLNGRIDLSQAEAVIDVINSKTEKEALVATKQLEGGISESIQAIRKKVLSILADIEATIDYPEYDLEEVTNVRILNVLNDVKMDLNKLENTFDNGKILREGIKTVILGRPNAGKSSLLNLILNEERAIVTSIEGTTRDTIEEYISIKGVPFKIIDTAGIRTTDDQVEIIGVQKALNLANECDIVIGIFDINKKLDEEDYRIIDVLKEKNSIIVLNKNDLDSNIEEKYINSLNIPVVYISTIKKEGIDKLYEEMYKIYKFDESVIDNETIVSNERHKNHIRKAMENVDISIGTINEGLPIDMISTNIKEVIEELGKITGDSVTEDIINEIFSKFCLGK
ncbi:MAG: tRNA uridine-5-carboxymethylaminomethyl(34) synthesis GTPase MnmE [Clostridia bacterium]|nr:tRNA uridine-5-carboxymethylaminomethyl(34) synthesis GTPase MnmE [Clostridia bacterium]